MVMFVCGVGGTIVHAYYNAASVERETGDPKVAGKRKCPHSRQGGNGLSEKGADVAAFVACFLVIL